MDCEHPKKKGLNLLSDASMLDIDIAELVEHVFSCPSRTHFLNTLMFYHQNPEEDEVFYKMFNLDTIPSDVTDEEQFIANFVVSDHIEVELMKVDRRHSELPMLLRTRKGAALMRLFVSRLNRYFSFVAMNADAMLVENLSMVLDSLLKIREFLEPPLFDAFVEEWFGGRFEMVIKGWSFPITDSEKLNELLSFYIPQF